MSGYQRILLATDLTAAAAGAARRAAAVARCHDAGLTLLHVAEYGEADDAEARAQERLATLAAELDYPRAETRVLPTEQAAHQGILRVAEELGADLIVLGVLGHPGRLGLTVNDVTANARCDVLVVQGGAWQPA